MAPSSALTFSRLMAQTLAAPVHSELQIKKSRFLGCVQPVADRAAAQAIVAQLRAAGVPTMVDRTSAHMHHKFAIFDGQWLLNGSYNWTRSACAHNEENLVATNDPTLVRQFQGAFDQLWVQLSS